MNTVFQCFIGALIGFLLSFGVMRLARWRHARAVARRWRGTACLLAVLLPLAGCPAIQPGGDPQLQQFQGQVQFWTDETARLRAAVETLPQGKSRDDLVKQLTQAQYWLAFFNALVNPPAVPATQPVKAV